MTDTDTDTEGATVPTTPTTTEPEANTPVVLAEGDAGDGPSSHTTCGQFPATEVRDTFTAEPTP